MAILTQPLLPLMRRYLVAFSFFAAGHTSCDYLGVNKTSSVKGGTGAMA